MVTRSDTIEAHPGDAARSGARALMRASILSMLALLALGSSRLIHGSLVSHATDPQTYGRVGTLIGFANVAGLFIPAGLASAAVKFVAQRLGQGDSGAAVRRLLTIVNFASAGVLGVVTAALAAWTYDASSAEALAVGLLTFGFATYSVDKGLLYGFGEVTPYARLELLGSGLAVIITVAVVVTGGTSFLLPLTAGYLIVVLGTRLVLRKRPRSGAALRSHERHEIWIYIGLASLGAVSAAGFLQGMPVLASWYTSTAEVGYFAAAVTLVGPLYFLPRALGMALFPAMSEAQGAGRSDAVRRNADVSMRILIVCLAPLFAAVLPLAPQLMQLFGGQAFTPGGPVLRLMLVATYLAVIPVGAVNALSSGSSRDVARPVGYAVLGCLVGLGLIPLLGTRFGAVGVGVCYLVGVLLTSGGPIVVVWRRYAMPWLGPMVRAAAAVTAGYVVAVLAEDGGLLIAVAGGAAAGVFGLALHIGDLRTILRDVRSR